MVAVLVVELAGPRSRLLVAIQTILIFDCIITSVLDLLDHRHRNYAVAVATQ